MAGRHARPAPLVISRALATLVASVLLLAVGVVAAVRSGAFSLSSNRVDPTGACGGVGWIISPEGRVLATTSPAAPAVTVDVDLAAPAAARLGYPCAVLRD